MFFFGIAALFQVLVLPGLILTRVVKASLRPVASAAAVISSSLVINYCLVFLLTALGVFIRPVVLLVVAGEIIYLIFSFSYQLDMAVNDWLQKARNQIKKIFIKVKSFFLFDENSSELARMANAIYVVLCFFLAAVALNWIIKLFFWNFGTVFNSYDSFAQWNRWALQWAGNRLPIGTWRYPQLLPANWSLVYVIIGSVEIQFFIQAITPLFTFFILVWMLDLAFEKRNPGFLIGAGITYLVLKKFLGSFLIEALADMPAAFMAFTAFYLFLDANKNLETDPAESRLLPFIAISAAGAAVTKQIGLAFFLLFAFYYFLFSWIPLYKRDRKSAFRAMLTFGLIAFVVSAPWYIYKQVQIWQGIEQSEAGMILGATSHAFNQAALVDQALLIMRSLGKYFYLLAFTLVLSFWSGSLLAGAAWFLVLPLFAGWAVVASYDFRNLAPALPIFGICAGAAIHIVAEKVIHLFGKTPLARVKIRHVIVVLTLLSLAATIWALPDAELVTRQQSLGMQSFSPVINTFLLDTVKQDNNDFAVITNYPIETIPGMAGKKISILFDDYENYLYTVSTNPQANLYLLVPVNASQQVLDDISARTISGDYQLLLTDDSFIPYQLLKVVRRPSIGDSQ